MNLLKHKRPYIDNIYFYVNDPFQSNYQLLINGREKVGIKTLKNPKVFVDYSQTIDVAYENLERCNPTKKRRILIVFDDMIAHTKSNKKYALLLLNCLFLRVKKLNILLAFISQTYIKMHKMLKLNATHRFIIKIPNKRGLQQITSNHSSDFDFKDFMELYKDFTKEPYSFFVSDTFLSWDNLLRFRKNLLYNDY